MCRSPPTSPHEVATGSCSIQDTSCDSDSDFSTEDMLKRKNTELHELQAQMLRLPRASERRKHLKSSVDLLDKEIKGLQATFAMSSEVQKSASALNASIKSDDPDAIAACLQFLIKRTAGLTTIDDVVIFYLISAGEGVVESMRQHPTHKGVISGGCNALCSLFAGLKHLNNGDSIARQLSSSEVGDAVIQGMSSLPEDRDVQYWGCRLINVLAVNLNATAGLKIEHSQAVLCDDLESSIATACFFASARVAVSKARRNHAQDAEVTQWADCAMRLL